jgi:hypothetical protein
MKESRISLGKVLTNPLKSDPASRKSCPILGSSLSHERNTESRIDHLALDASGVLAENQTLTRRLDEVQEKLARAENDRKLLQSKNTRLKDRISQLENQLVDAENRYRRDLGVKQFEIESLVKSRNEWERVSMEYRSREKQFKTEIKRNLNEIDKFKKN